MATESSRRLHHNTPAWVAGGSVFHIRCRVAGQNTQNLTQPQIARSLIESAAYYHTQGTWFCHLFVLMPDHLHALLCFPPDTKMSTVVGRWKAWQKRMHKIQWQENYFDHRMRDNQEFELKALYIRNNPVVKKLCDKPSDWPWMLDANLLDLKSP